jgi:hypothetical protein
MSLTFEKIIERMVDENKVYRNKFIEPYDMLATKVEEIKRSMDNSNQIVDKETGEILAPAELDSDPLKNITKEQRLEVLTKVLKDIESREAQMEERLDFLNEKMLERALEEKEVQEIATLGNFLNKIEKQKESIGQAKNVALAGGKTGIGGPGY